MKHASLAIYVAIAVAALGLVPLQPTDLGTVEHTAVIVAYNGLPDLSPSAPRIGGH